jgi:hypothetical protein
VAHQGLDLTFGLEGTSTSHVSGFGGWPLAVVVGIDGRPTLACSAPDQRLADQRLTPGPRLRNAPIDTPRIVSFPLNGRPFGRGAGATASFGPEADDPFLLGRAIAHRDRIAVLGGLIHGGHSTLALQIFQAGQPVGGISSWVAAPRRQFSGLSGRPGQYALGWLGSDPVVVAAQQFTGETLRLFVYVDAGAKGTLTVQVPVGRLALTAGFDVQPWVSSVAADAQRRLLIGISWVGLDPARGRFRPLGAIDESRASVLRLRRTSSGWVPDTAFAPDGLWIAAAKEGKITTADHVAATATSVTCVGRATRSGAHSLFAASLDPTHGHVRWTSHPAPGVLQEPTGIALDAAGRLLACGATRPLDMNYPPDDPAEAIVVCLTPSGQLDPAFAANGIARFRLNGGTYATAVTVTPTADLLIGSVLRWGGQGVGRFHPCVTHLTSGGQVDQAFGLGGVARQDGLGAAELATVDVAGRVWSGGVGSAFDGMVPGFRPWDPPVTSWIQYVTVSRLARDGGLESGFGLDGIVDHQLHSLDSRLEHFNVDSLVSLASGGAVLSGDYGSIVVNQTTGERSYQTAGTWVARLTASGGLDGAFGTGGLKVYPARWFQLAAELAPTGTASHGELQGWEFVTGGQAPLRLVSDGTAAPGFGPSGAKPVNAAVVTLPLDYEPDGEWFAPIWDRQYGNSIELVRCAPNGTIDQTFGAGSATYDPSAYVNATSIQNPPTFPAVHPEWEKYGGPHRTVHLADGTYLTLWTVTWQETVNLLGGSVTWPETAGLVLIAWTASGKPRSVPQWGGKSVKAIPNPVRSSSPFTNWLGWKYRCALLQSDGSLIVGLEGEDAGAIPANLTPAFIRTSAYFAHLRGPEFDLDPGFGGGHVVRRLPGEDHQIPSNNPPASGPVLIDYQSPTGLQTVGGGTVVVAVSTQTVTANTLRLSPDLLADGSVGILRLV